MDRHTFMYRCEYRNRTKKSWEKMRNLFYAEWRDGFDTVQEHQFRVTRRNGIHDAGQVSQYFSAHGERMQKERWPEFQRGDTV